MTLLLIVLGALVTSNDAGLSVPDWPTSFGSLYKIPPMVGGVKYEHGHRMFAEFVGLLIIAIAVWTQRVERRPWMKALGWIALASVVGQGVLGGLTVLLGLPWLVSTAHATLAQTIFCVVIAMALFSSKRWLQDAEPIAEDGVAPSTPALTALAAACVWVQLILGAAFRHTGIRLLPHVIGACVVTAMLCWTVVRILTRYNGASQLRRPAQLILAMLMVQLGLGFAAYVSRLVWMLNPPQPTIWIVVSTVAHVAGGAIVLATAVVLAIQSRRMIHAGGREGVVATSSRKAVAA
jgi:cytochrome c oxidase assembly protein subunit 15